MIFSPDLLDRALITLLLTLDGDKKEIGRYVMSSALAAMAALGHQETILAATGDRLSTAKTGR